MTDVLFRNATVHADGFRDLDPLVLHAHARYGATLIIDVREPHEYSGELGHIPGSELVPLASVPAKAGAWDREREIVMVCRSGNRSGTAARQLVQMGFTRVMNLRGGMLAYGATNLPVQRADVPSA